MFDTVGLAASVSWHDPNGRRDSMYRHRRAEKTEGEAARLLRKDKEQQEISNICFHSQEEQYRNQRVISKNSESSFARKPKRK